jgi:3-phosphoshikimate 1-carboxyvinyltransferase
MVLEPVPTRDHTERMLGWFGAEVTSTPGETGTQISLSGTSTLRARDLTIPADISSAAFFMVAAACMPDSSISMENVGINPTRRAVLDVLRDLGADIEIMNEKEICNEPVASIKVRGGIRPGATGTPVLSGAVVANLIDEIPILAVFATQLAAGLEVRGAAELRVKESDRIAAIIANLRRMNAVVTEFPDGFRVERSCLEGAVVDSYADHRIAMAFSVAGLMARGKTNIIGAQCADISFPGFLKTLLSVVK